MAQQFLSRAVLANEVMAAFSNYACALFLALNRQDKGSVSLMQALDLGLRQLREQGAFQSSPPGRAFSAASLSNFALTMHLGANCTQSLTAKTHWPAGTATDVLMSHSEFANATEHLFSVQIYHEDTDFSGVVYHAYFIKYFEVQGSMLLAPTYCGNYDESKALVLRSIAVA